MTARRQWQTLALASALALAADAAIAATAFLKSTGNDGTACTFSAPCKSLPNAITAAGAGGQVRCLDVGDYFLGVQISNPVTIDCRDYPFTIGSSTLTINSSSTDPIVIRGVRLTGTDFNSGIEVIGGGGNVHLDDVRVDGWGSSGGGINIRPNAGARVLITNSLVFGNTAAGVNIRPVGNQPTTVILDNVIVNRNGIGIKADASQTTAQVDVEVRESISSGNGTNGFIAVSEAGRPQVRFKITRSAAFDNGAYGAVASGPQAFMIVDGSSLTKNATGLGQLNGATVASYGNNAINFNTANTVGTITSIPMR